MKRPLHSLFLAAYASLSVAASSPPVQVSLRTSWPAPPVLIEILETVGLENPDAFFPFLDLITDPEVLHSSTSLSPEAIHQASLKVAVSKGLFAKPGSLSNVELQLALHAASPKIEAFYNYYTSYVNKTLACNGGSWVDWYGEVVCDVDTLKKLAGTETIGTGAYPRPEALSFDHAYPPSEQLVSKPARTAILYVSLPSPNFRALHTYLYALASQDDPRVEYVLRHIPPPHRENGRRTNLSGYGVSLDLKKMDYLALDDRFSGGKRQQSTKDDELEGEELLDPVQALIETFPLDDSAPDASVALTKEEIEDLGAKAAQLIASSPSPLDTLLQLSQDFPRYATSLARRVSANSSISDELHANSLKAKRGVNVLWLNGVAVENHDVEPLPLLRLLKKERTLMVGLEAVGLSRQQAFGVLTHPAVAGAQREAGGADVLYDASDRAEGGGLVVYWNDLEKDARYAGWSPTLHTLIRPMYPGQFPSVKANLFNTVLALDLSQVGAVNFIVGPVSNIIERGLPFRFGVVPIVETEDGKKMARLFYHLIKNYGRKKTLGFLRKLAQPDLQPQDPPLVTNVDWKAVAKAYEELAEAELVDEPDKVAASLSDVLQGKFTLPPPIAPVEGETQGEGVEWPSVERQLGEYHRRLETSLKGAKEGHAFFNGKHYPFDGNFLKGLQSDAMEHQQYFMEKVYRGQLTDDILRNEGLGNHFYDLPTTNRKRNRYVFPKTRADVRIVNLGEVGERVGVVGAGGYVYPKVNAEEKERDAPVLSVFVLGDFDAEGGRVLAAEALKSTERDGAASRITFVPNPAELDAVKAGSRNAVVSRVVVQELLREAGRGDLAEVFSSSLPTSSGVKDAIARLTAGTNDAEFTQGKMQAHLKASRLFAREAGVKPGESAVVINGRVVGPIEDGEFGAFEFETLEEYEMRKRTGPVVGALVELGVDMQDRDRFSDAAAVASSIIAWSQVQDPSETGMFDTPPRPRQKTWEMLDSNYTAFEFGDKSNALYHLVFLVDPLSGTGQKWASVVQWLANIPDVFIQVQLNPDKYAELPLKRFYRYNLLSSLSFDTDGQEIPSQIVFNNLPIDPIYTLAMDVPASWLVRPKESRYDLDNIQLGQLFPPDTSLSAIFSLDALLIEGHAREVATQSPPRGVQLQVVTTSEGRSVPVQDTLVVANLGYFQFRLNPGVYGLEIRAGRGRRVFGMESAGGVGWESPGVEEVGNRVALVDFEGVTLFPRLRRNKGMEEEDVLEDGEEEVGGGVLSGFSNKVKAMFTTRKEETGVAMVKKEQAEINIFTVASGLLYERFASIMILSVLKNTNHTVKFWFIENFLSPSFLEFIPHMAAEYNFDYELVTYRWPSWLRAQTEKQRIIWAYKILFLDVLFPMDLKKVIFVDADQIVRADLKELVDLDMQGAPYGYTPMGDDNTDMEGFRFWKTGYWKDFLMGKPYHISALYVIDLVKFRQMAAGDILRQQYQGLSADPNSLANLDQDLPNNLQRQVPIFSLHEDWLWCETWCSKDRLHRAKTIDLCQNPLTKEPKLSRARQIPEWEAYDAEIACLTRRLAEEGKISSGLATADANVLAGGSSSAEKTEPEPVEEAPAADAVGEEHARPTDEL
ncbi:hypothetical protein FA15DRAFT_759842 [Coprinopsis marcescibilis]|uniref:UDP-glucose:glycoprotein glucosyltransferase n=1 Tax=Coprinopsis marcescibilis TaxID=230819 RepID=A0A5C3KIL8_COPMA|nr:hypothetical protein FA15DRAFT_759842 [Coprinopsis marcescibilis]